jgi:uncharacterized protein YidB (DUF937 family)
MSKSFPSMTALLGLIAVAGYQNRDSIAEMMRGLGANNPPAPGRRSQSSRWDAVLGGSRGAVASAGVSSLLSNGLGELLERFKQNGREDVAQSWIGRGPNQDIGPNELHAALGTDVLSELSHRTGLPSDELLARLSQQLPAAVDKYTPEGRLPISIRQAAEDHELAKATVQQSG